MSKSPSLTEQRTAVDADGWLYDVDTGEILGIPDLPANFAVDCNQAADAALEIRSRIEARLVALRSRKAALVANIERMEADQRRRLQWWEWRFSHGLIEFARKMLGKGKTAKFFHGSVSFRATKGTNRIIDMERAVAWMRDVDPDRVHVVETVLVSDVLATRRKDDVLPWLESTGPGESVTISTGITHEEAR